MVFDLELLLELQGGDYGVVEVQAVQVVGFPGLPSLGDDEAQEEDQGHVEDHCECADGQIFAGADFLGSVVLAVEGDHHAEDGLELDGFEEVEEG